jgi:protoheme IX farnesyltransferase
VVLSAFGVWVLPEGGLLYGLLLLPFNARLLQMVKYLSLTPESAERAKGLFRWSILYLFGVCLLLILSRLPAGAHFDQQVHSLLAPVISGLPRTAA